MEQTSRLAIVQLSPFQKRDVPRRLVFVVDLPRARNARNCPRAYREFPRGALIAFGVCEFRTKLITFRPERWCDWRHLVHFHATTKQQKMRPPKHQFHILVRRIGCYRFWTGFAGEELAVLIEWLIDWRTRFKRSKTVIHLFLHTHNSDANFGARLWSLVTHCPVFFDGSRRA